MYKILKLFFVMMTMGILFTVNHEIRAQGTSNLAISKEEVKVPQQSSKTDYTKILASDIVLGSKSAKSYLIVYTSFTCPHCSDFYTKTFPIIKAELIDTHKIAYVNRSFLSDRVALAGTMLAYCNGSEEYYTILKVLFAKAPYWVMQNDYIQALEKIASLAGISSTKFQECLVNKSLQDELITRQREAISQLQITAIPTIVINGKKFEGALSYEKIKQELHLL